MKYLVDPKILPTTNARCITFCRIKPMYGVPTCNRILAG